jgi:hypothetical protein
MHFKKLSLNLLYLIIDWLVAMLIAVGLIYGFKRLISLSEK